MWYLIVSIPDLCTLSYFEYTHAERIEFCVKRKQEIPTEQRRLLRSESTFDFMTDCVFFGKTTDSKQFNDKRQVRCVKT